MNCLTIRLGKGGIWKEWKERMDVYVYVLLSFSEKKVMIPTEDDSKRKSDDGDQ